MSTFHGLGGAAEAMVIEYSMFENSPRPLGMQNALMETVGPRTHHAARRQSEAGSKIKSTDTRVPGIMTARNGHREPVGPPGIARTSSHIRHIPHSGLMEVAMRE